MGQAASQIENHIDDKREDLGQNLRELESRVKSAADWRCQFRNHPGIFLGAAMGGGMLLALAFGGSSGRHRDRRSGSPAAESLADGSRAPRPVRPTSPAVENAMHAWNNIKGALVGVAAARLKDYAEQVIPGFSTQYERTEVRHPT